MSDIDDALTEILAAAGITPTPTGERIERATHTVIDGAHPKWWASVTQPQGNTITIDMLRKAFDRVAEPDTYTYQGIEFRPKPTNGTFVHLNDLTP